MTYSELQKLKDNPTIGIYARSVGEISELLFNFKAVKIAGKHTINHPMIFGAGSQGIEPLPHDSMHIRRITLAIDSDIAKAMQASPVTGRDFNFAVKDEALKVESLEKSLTTLEFRKRDVLLWQMMGIVDSRIRFPRKLKKSMSEYSKRNKLFDIKTARLKKLAAELPDDMDFQLMIGREIIVLGTKLLIDPIK